MEWKTSVTFLLLTLAVGGLSQRGFELLENKSPAKLQPLDICEKNCGQTVEKAYKKCSEGGSPVPVVYQCIVATMNNNPFDCVPCICHLVPDVCQPEGGKCYELGIDTLGYDLPGMPIKNVDGPYTCQQLCQFNPLCNNWTYGFLVVSDGPCWLKYAAGIRDHTPASISGPKYCPPGRGPSG